MRRCNPPVGTEELAHLEMIGAIVYQLTRDLTPEQIKEAGFDAYFVDHTTGIYPSSAAGVPFTAAYLQSKGDVITDLHEDMAAEQKARTTYDNILRFTDDPDVIDPIRFLRAREVVHYQRFGEGLRITTDKLNSKNFYAFNPSFDRCDKKEKCEKKAEEKGMDREKNGIVKKCLTLTKCQTATSGKKVKYKKAARYSFVRVAF